MIGKTVSHYRIVEKLGEGGAGVVYRAEDTKLRRTVALKFLRGAVVGDEEQRARFISEAQAAASLDHPSICTVYEIGESEGQAFISMAYIDGVDLDEKVRSGPLPLAEAVDLVTQIAEGLREAHAQGIIHRDIKSPNVKLTSKGQVKILDFGLAKLPAPITVTREGTASGTVAYMSPEQARGEEVDHRTDIWSLGVILYEMITGRLPYRGDYEQAVIYSILNEEPTPVAELREDVPRLLEQIVGRAMVKRPGERYQDADELLADLRAVKGETAVPGSAIARAKSGGERAARVSLLHNLLHRHVPQIAGAYLAAGWGIVLLVRWLVDQYPLSPNLPDLFLVILASMIPAVLLISYFRRAPGRPGWKKVGMVGIPANALVALVLVLVVFHDQELGGATTTVTLRGEQGELVERVVPKSEFRKKVAIFGFDNESGDDTHDWMRHGVAEMLDLDLSQDMYLRTQASFSSALREKGFDTGTGVPLALKMKTARELHYNHFIAGSFTVRGDTIEVSMGIYDTEQGVAVAEHSFSGPGVFRTVDAMAIQLKRDLGIPTYHIQETVDLPVAERLTDSPAAARSYFRGRFASVFQDDYESATALMEEAVEEDPAFALAQAKLGMIYWTLQRPEKAEAAMRAAMQHRYKLPESYQFDLRDTYHLLFQEDLSAALGNARNWVELYPESVEAHESLATSYALLKELDQAIAERETILRIDPQRHEQLHEIASLLQQKGEFESALEYLETYASRFPDRHESYTGLAGLYREMGDYERAKSHYEKARVLEPERASILVELARLDTRLGNFEDVSNRLEEALRVAATPEDSSTVYGVFLQYHLLRGQIVRALEDNELILREIEKTLPPINVALQRMMTLAIYAVVGREETAFRLIRESASSLGNLPLVRGILRIGHVQIYLFLEDPGKVDDFEEQVDELEAFIEESHIEAWRPLVYFGRGEIHKLRGDFPQAAEMFERALDGSADASSRVEAGLRIGQCLRETGDYARAEDFLRRAQELIPSEARVHHEMALVSYAQGRREEAWSHLRTALRIWEEADPDFRAAQKARATLAEWQSPGS